MIRVGREVRYRTDYILGTDFHLFWNVSVQDPRHNSDHYMVLGCLCITPLRKHSRYLGGHKRLPLRPPTTTTREDIYIFLPACFHCSQRCNLLGQKISL